MCSTVVQNEHAQITPSPELRLRNAAPAPQAIATDCSQLSQSASQAIQQATQSANQSIQQAQQSASQAIQQATQQASQTVQQAQQAATQAIQQFSNQASQSIAAASRSVTSAISSASSAIARIQSSADQAISSANGSMSSVLLAAAKATQTAQASVASVDVAAATSTSQSNPQAGVAVTAREVALAIVGSTVLSTLITSLICFLVIRHKQHTSKRSNNQEDAEYPNDAKFSESDRDSTTSTKSSESSHGIEGQQYHNPAISLSSTMDSIKDGLRTPVIKTTKVGWNPRKPPKPPIIKSWQTLQHSTSPVGPINLSVVSAPGPLTGQLKSPLQSTHSPQYQAPLCITSSTSSTSTSVPTQVRLFTFKKQPSIASQVPYMAARPNITVIAPKVDAISSRSHKVRNRESRGSVLADQSIENSMPTPVLNLFPKTSTRSQQVNATARESTMRLPEPANNVRNTTEWLASPSRIASLGERD